MANLSSYGRKQFCILIELIGLKDYLLTLMKPFWPILDNTLFHTHRHL